MKAEIKRADALGAKQMAFHPGPMLGLGQQQRLPKSLRG